MGTPPGWGLERRASNPVSVKNLTAIETSKIVKLLRPYVPVGTKRTSNSSSTINKQICWNMKPENRWCWELFNYEIQTKVDGDIYQDQAWYCDLKLKDSRKYPCYLHNIWQEK
jgi:hypothetical protein